MNYLQDLYGNSGYKKLTYKEKIQYFYTKDEYLINRRNEQRGLHMIRNRT